MNKNATYETPEWRRIARQAMREADRQICEQHRAGIFDDGDPNHPKFNNGINYATGLPVSIFGYETPAFMARQYAVRCKP